MTVTSTLKSPSAYWNDQGARVTTCSDGASALATLRTQHENIDVVLMDVQMPFVDGNEATRRIRGELRLTALPIVALTRVPWWASVSVHWTPA